MHPDVQKILDEFLIKNDGILDNSEKELNEYLDTIIPSKEKEQKKTSLSPNQLKELNEYLDELINNRPTIEEVEKDLGRKIR